MKNVLVLVHQDPGQEARLQAALDLTRALSGHLTCVGVTPLPLVFDQGMSTAPVVILDEADQERDNRTKLRRRLEAEDVRWSWLDLRDDFVTSVLEAAATSDVIVLNRKLDTGSRMDMREIAASILTQSNALVVAVDERCRGLDVGMPALIAWDGSEEALHALQRAMPLLKLAGSVRIFQAGPLRDGGIPAAEAALYLSRHEVGCEIEIAPDSKDVAAAICEAAERMHAGYCVMGAFGHSRWREALFGGASHDMLGEAKVPLMMAH